MDTAEVASKLVKWIQSTVSAAGGKGVVLGLSGGIDSSVLAVLCKQAFPENTLGIIMPCYSNSDDEKHARMVSEKFGIETKKVDLDPVFDIFLKTAGANREEDSILAIANIKARLRMLTLYYYANKLSYLVAGSSDRSELTVGFFTKYGDGASDFMPISRLLKTQVKEMGKYLGVPQVIVEKPPSPGLVPGRTAESELGITYEEIDRYIVTGKASPEIEGRIESMMKRSEHKRRLPPSPDL